MWSHCLGFRVFDDSKARLSSCRHHYTIHYKICKSIGICKYLKLKILATNINYGTWSEIKFYVQRGLIKFHYNHFFNGIIVKKFLTQSHWGVIEIALSLF